MLQPMGHTRVALLQPLPAGLGDSPWSSGLWLGSPTSSRGLLWTAP